MTNKITQAERAEVNQRAAELYREEGNQQAPAVVRLMAERPISIQRARTAVAHAMLKTPPAERG